MKSLAIKAFATALMAGTAFSGAMAADIPSPRKAPNAPAMTVWNPWMVRGRALVVMPQEKASGMMVGGAPLVGGDVSISTSVVPELDISYFFNQNFAVELILGVTPHKVKGAGVLPVVTGGAAGPLGNAWLLPPTLTLQYHFTGLGNIKPYVGAGVNYTVFFNEKGSGLFNRMDLRDSFGLALQAGVDIMLTPNWGLNFDVKKIFLETKAKLYTPGAALPLATTKVKIDPWLIGTGVTYKF